MSLLARRFDTLAPVRIEFHDQRRARVVPLERDLSPAELAALPWLAPGFVDIQVNGFAGQEFSSLALTPEKVASIVRRHFAFGVTSICPTLTTESDEVFTHGVSAIATACDQFPDVGRAVIGIHLEGPFITPEDGPRGAHPLAHCRPPDWPAFEGWQKAAGGRIKLITLSPEYPEAPEFIRRATASGVSVALGHLSATGEQIRRAVDAGARLSTHLGNGAHRQLRRHPNYLWDQLAEDRLSASLIADGHHLPPEVLKTFVRAKGPERCILVSDVSGLAGLPPGTYSSSGCELEILPDGRLVIAGQDQLLAGASLPIAVGIATMLRDADVSLRAAIDMATTNPLRLLGTERPEIDSPGADLVVFSLAPDARPPEILATIAGGELVYGAAASG